MSPSMFFIGRRPNFHLTSRDIRYLRTCPELRGGDAVIGVPARCLHGAPQVLLCAPMKKNIPFPTSFWLICPYLAKKIGALEARQGVAELEEYLSARAPDWLGFHQWHARLRLTLLSEGAKRFLRRFRKPRYRALLRGGVGGIFYSSGACHVKCLHLQTASYMAMGRHPGAEWLREHLAPFSCAAGLCAFAKESITL